MVQSLATRVTAFASQLVLAWLLVPADFGLIGLAYTVTTLVNTVVNFGLDDVLLQRQRSMHLWSSMAVWLSFGFGLFGMAVLFVAAPIFQALYHVPGLGGLIAVLALAMPIGALATVPMVLLRAALNFRFLAGWGAFELMATQALAILLAWRGFGAYAFAIPAPLLALLRVIVFWRVAPARVTRRLRLRRARFLLGNGTLVLGNRVLTELVGQGDYITLGVMATQSVVGIYYFAFRLAAQPVRMLAGNFQSVIFPALVRLGDDPQRQGRAAIDASLMLAYLVMPLCFLQAAVAEPLVHVVFNHKWTGAVPLIQALSVGLPFDAVSWIAGALLHARGAFWRSFVFSAVAAPVFFALVAVGAWRGAAEGVAIGVALFYLTVPTFYSWRIFTGYGVSPRSIARVYLAPTLLAGASMGGAYLLSLAPVWTAQPILRLAVIGAVGPALYIAAIWLLDRPAFVQIVRHVGLDRAWRRMRLQLAG